MRALKVVARPVGLNLCLWFTAMGAGPNQANASQVDLTQAVVVAPKNLTGPERKALAMLVDEVQKRTLVRWEVVNAWPAQPKPVIAVGPAASLADFGGPLEPRRGDDAVSRKAEGYRIDVLTRCRPKPAVFVVGNDARGVLFGVGRLLREMHLDRNKITLADDLHVATAPKHPLRGHQLGYRPKTNSYDAWNLAQWEQYIRDLAVFGCNAIELIPPRSDDDADSPHFPLPPMDMMVGMSKILADYGLDVWIWYPAMDRDYGDPKTVEFALKEWGEVFRKLPRIDVVMVPGGDPGHTKPVHLMRLLEKQTANLRRYHPKGQMWVSPQSFNAEWLNEFYDLVRAEPAWLGGIVHGPQVRVTPGELRKAIPARYPIRRYPDITHSLRCEFPVPDWDLAYAMTEAREVINPRPMDQATIFHAYADAAIGFLTYSEGCNDDVNKIVWSGLGWDPAANVVDTLRQYARYFIGDRYGDNFAQGLMALERNWRGPLIANESVYQTLDQFRDLERKATPADLQNWRFQQALYRAYYDAYVRCRLIRETELEDLATATLRTAKQIGATAAMNRATAILDRAVHEPIAGEWRARIHELAEALFQSIRMQLSVERYKAIDVGRGANLDTLDMPLNNRLWLRRRFADVQKLESEPERLRAIDDIVRWTDPGPGGFYDDLGNPARQPHLIKRPGFAKDPGFYQSPRTGFAPFPGRRLSQCRHAETMFETPLHMRYDNLDPTAAYRIRICYGGDPTTARIRLTANDGVQVHPYLRKESQPVEFDIPRAATRTGMLELVWTQEQGQRGAGRSCQVSEVWLMKK